MSSTVCGQIVPCAVYLTQYPFNISMNIEYEFNYVLALGYNKLILPQPLLVKRGQFVMLTQITGRIAIDTRNNSSFSDLVWNTTTQWTKLAEFLNWRFYLTPITNYTTYETTFNLVHTYSTVGVYTLTLNFTSSNQLYQQIVNITDCK